MKHRRSVILCSFLGALFFFSAGVFTGQRWLSEPAGVPGDASQRPRTAARLLPAQPVENSPSAKGRRTGEREDEPSLEDWVEQTEKKIAALADQFESIRDLTDDKLIIAVRALNLPNSSITALYSQYVEETAALEQASQGGFGARHPKIMALNASLDIKYAQLLEASEAEKRDLEGQLKATRRMLEVERSALRAPDSRNFRHAKSYDNPLPRLSPMAEHHVQITIDEFPPAKRINKAEAARDTN
jgi:hypothetical protein